MKLKYKVMSTHKPGQGKEGDLLWFPKITGSSQVDLDGVIAYVEERTTASGIDVQVVLYALISLIPELLVNGNTVKLADFGTFRLHAKAETAPTKEEVSEKNIKELRMSFRPGRMMKNALKIVSYEKVD